MIDSCAYEPNPLLTVDEAQARIRAAVIPIQDIEAVSLANALGRILADPVYARTDVPGENNAAMDGYAFISEDIPANGLFSLRCVGTSWAGRPFLGQLSLGKCVRIFTGAAMPKEADSVIMQEQVRTEGSTVFFPEQAQPKQNVRFAGEDIRFGDSVCAYPKQLTAIDLSLIAAAGVEVISVRRKLKIAFFSTGDELMALGQPLASGQIYDSNRYLLAGLLSENAYSIRDGGVIRDDKQLLARQLLEASQDCDAIITTGGASVGDADYIRDILQAYGRADFWKILMKPGKPFAFGKIGGSYFFGLPGNPGAVLATFKQLVQPALQQLLGLAAKSPLRLMATANSVLKKSPGRQEFQAGVLSQDGNGEFFVDSAGRQGSNLLGTLHKANCYIVLPKECQGIEKGEKVVVEPFTLFI